MKWFHFLADLMIMIMMTTLVTMTTTKRCDYDKWICMIVIHHILSVVGAQWSKEEEIMKSWKCSPKQKKPWGPCQSQHLSICIRSFSDSYSIILRRYFFQGAASQEKICRKHHWSFYHPNNPSLFREKIRLISYPHHPSSSLSPTKKKHGNLWETQAINIYIHQHVIYIYVYV